MEAFIGVRSGSSGTVVEATDVVVMAASIQNATATATGGGGGVLTVAALRATTNIASTVQAVVATTVTASGAVTVQAGQTANADSTVIVGAVALGVGTGAEARSTVGGLVAARVGPGATVSAGGELTVSADTAARSHAKAEGGSGGGVGINVMLGDATTSVVTSASIGDGSRVLRAAGITMWARRGGITGLAETTLGEILVVGVGFVDGSGGRGDATDSGGVTAAVGDNAELTATGGVVDVSASSVTLTKGVARGFSVSLVTSVVVPVTHATHSATTAAAVGANTAVTAASLAVTASATTNVRVEALTVGVSLAGGAGSDAQAQSSGLTEARVGPAFGTTVAATRGVNVTGAVTIRAAVAQTAEAEARSGAGGAIGIGGLTVRAFVDGSTRAFVGNGARVQAGSLTIEVTGVTGTSAVRTATSNSTVGSVGLVGGAGSSSTSRISGSLDAFIGDGATVVVAGAVIVRSTGTATATADARGGTAAAIGIAAFFASASIAPVSGTDMGTRAWVGANSNVVAGGALVVSANAIDRATATLLAVAVTLGGGAGGSATATVDSDVEAFIGVRSGSSGTVVEATDVVVMAASIQNATATATGGGGGVLTVAALRATTNIASTVQAVVATTVTASGAVTVQAGQTANADSTVIVGAVALGVGTGAEARSTVGGLVAARVGPGATVSAGGELTVSADTAARSHAKAEGGSGGGVGINVMLGDATTSVVTSASIGDGSRVLRAAGITMWARRGGITGLAETTLGEILVVGVGFVDGSGGRGDATDSGGVTAAVGDNAELTATGGVVDVSASSVTLTKGVARGFSVSLVTSVVVPVTHATHSATTAAAVGANTAVTAASLAVTASATTNVRVEALTVGVSLAGGAGSDAQAQSSGLTEARVGPAFGTTVAATRGVNVTGAVTIRAAVAQTAEAEARSGAGGAIGIGGLTVRAFVDGSTRAFVGNGARVQAGSLTIEVRGVSGDIRHSHGDI